MRGSKGRDGGAGSATVESAAREQRAPEQCAPDQRSLAQRAPDAPDAAGAGGVIGTERQALVAPVSCPLLICLLGPFQALNYGQPITLRSHKVESLLRRLALHQEAGVLRDDLLAQLWPDQEPALAAQSLNSLVYMVQRALRAALGGAAAIVHDEARYRLNQAAGVTVDVRLFDALVEIGLRLARAGDDAGANVAYRSAVEQYRGDLGVGSTIGDIIERERLRARYLTVLAHLADDAFAQDEYGAALEYANRILAADPCREDAHRLVMRCRVRRGERAQALRQFRLCAEILLAEFDAPPEPATLAIFDQIRLDPTGV